MNLNTPKRHRFLRYFRPIAFFVRFTTRYSFPSGETIQLSAAAVTDSPWIPVTLWLYHRRPVLTKSYFWLVPFSPKKLPALIAFLAVKEKSLPRLHFPFISSRWQLTKSWTNLRSGHQFQQGKKFLNELNQQSSFKFKFKTFLNDGYREAEKRDFAVPVRIVDSSKDLNSYGLGNVDWKERIQGWKLKQEKNMLQMSGKIHEGKGGEIEGTGSNGEELQMDGDARLPMSCVITIPSSRMTPYRIVIVFRLLILGVFLHYRVTHPVKDAYPLWLTSVICEIWFAFSWLLDQFPKWCPINRETFLDRLALSLVLTTLCSSPSFITNLLHRVYVYRKFLKFDSSSGRKLKQGLVLLSWFRMDIQYGKERASTWSSSSLHVASALMAEALAVRSALLSAISKDAEKIQ
ncbi:unnamed protein product [Microthlaspi erraticum]|uniref:Uncharacterized protein n=1 Tax=Microthlaspi erraticum TaxID=1685480 RepID=A0A6D2JGD8_9BRAS|nr:unnamed protein product [Microthlaspi erraticum]